MCQKKGLGSTNSALKAQNALFGNDVATFRTEDSLSVFLRR